MSQSATPGRWWATLSVVAGGLWLALSLAPFFVTTLLGLPLAAAAFGAGWLGRRGAEPAVRRRALWGWGLGCAGCLWQVIYFGVLGGVLVAGLPTLIDYLQKTWMP